MEGPLEDQQGRGKLMQWKWVKTCLQRINSAFVRSISTDDSELAGYLQTSDKLFFSGSITK